MNNFRVTVDGTYTVNFMGQVLTVTVKDGVAISRESELDAELQILKNRYSELEGFLEATQEENEELEAKLEISRMQLVACGVAALQNTEKSKVDRITKDNPYYSASYKDACDAVDREIDLSAKLEIAVNTLKVITEDRCFDWDLMHTYDSRSKLQMFRGDCLEALEKLRGDT